MNRITIYGVLLFAGILTEYAWAENGKLSGYMFGDYYYIVSAEGEDQKGENAMRFRRMYLTYDKSIDEGISTRFRLEANDAGLGSGKKMVPFVKHAYVKLSDSLLGGELYVGLSGTPTWAHAEKVWGYRSIEKTVMDLNKIGSSADIGVSLKGKSGKLAYAAMIGNGPGQKSEDDEGKKMYGSLAFNLSESLIIEGYADYNFRSDDRSENTLKLFAGYRGDDFKGGVEIFSRTNEFGGDDGDIKISGISVFGSQPIMTKLKGFARFDAVQNDGKDVTDILVIAGLDHSPRTNLHWMPNLYVEKSDGGDPTIQGRMTVYFKF